MNRLKTIIIAMLLAGCCGSAAAQGYTGKVNPNCIGLKNPTNFTLSGSHQEKWTGYTGIKNAVASTCNTEGGTYNVTVQASELGTYLNTNGCSSVSYEGAAPQNSRDLNNNLDYQRQFVIKGAGTDPETHGHLSYLPPDTSFHTSIRLGNYCGEHGAEKLTYEIQVKPENAMITIWFALSLQNGRHSANQNPEFVIVVEKNTGSAASPNWQPLAGDTLCYTRPTPLANTGDTAFRVGATGAVMTTNSSSIDGDNIYLPWRKVMINLSDYTYQTVRIKITAGDCSMNVHYAAAYIAGDCQSKDLRATGCTAGESDAVTTIYAPKGAASYRWYRSKTGQLIGAAQSDESNYVLIEGATADSLGATLAHFRNVNTGDTANQSTFMCKMTTKMNDNIAVTSTVFTDVGNTKPRLSVDSTLDCNAGITLYDLSLAPYAPHDTNQVDTNLTRWEFYASNPPTPSTLVGTYYGGHATHTYPQGSTNYSVKVRTSAVGTSCWNEKTIPIRTIKPPVPSLRLSRDSLCEGDTIFIFNQTPGAAYNEWTIATEAGDTSYVSAQTATRYTFDTTSVVHIRTRNSTYYQEDTNTDGVLDRVYCYVDTSIVVHVDEYPVLEVTGDTIVCNGTQAIVDVASQNPQTVYDWYTSLQSTNPLQSNTNRLTTMPTHDTRYYVRARSPFGCESVDSINIYIVDPHLEVPIVKMCENDQVKLYASNAYSYTWSSMPDDPSMAGQTNNDTLVVSPQTTTTYTLIGHGMNNCSATPLTQTITVFHHPVPTFELSPDFIDSEVPEVTFRDVSPGSTYTFWDFGSGYTSTEKQVRHTFTDLSEDSVQIKLTTGTGGELQCNSDTAFYIPIEIFALWIPNAFTPEESTNNEFFILTHNNLEYFSFYLYDRRGSQILYTTDQNFKWDGTYKGKPCPTGVYVYTCTYRRPGTTDIVTQRGTVTVLR